MVAIQEAQVVVEVVEAVEDQQVVVDLHRAAEEAQAVAMIVNHLILGVLVDLAPVAEDHNYICQKLF